jgi:phosphinothricin acetyltransferase
MQAPHPVRLAAPADFEPIAAITNHYIRTSAIHFGHEPVTAAELQQQWREGELRYPWLCADHGGRVAGYAKAGPWRTRAAYHWTAETGLYVAHDLRGRGLGRALYGRLLTVLGAQGYRSVVAGATLPNAASVALHEALGFTSCGVVRDAGCKFGCWHDVGFWQLRLRTDDAPGGELRTPAAAFAATG